MWDLCRESVEGHYVPNAGFLEDAVFEDPSSFALNQPSDSSEGATHGFDAQQIHINDDTIRESVDVNDVISETFGETTQNDSENSAKEVTTDASDLKSIDNVAAANSDIELQSLSLEDVDSHLDKCLLHALHKTVKDKDLPMPGSSLW